MKIKLNIILALTFLCVWTLLVLIEVKIGNYVLLKYIYIITILCIVISFIWANKNILKNSDNTISITILNYGIGLIISLIFIFIGMVIVTNFKLLIGGLL